MKKLNSGSLQLVTFIIVVIALLLSSFILLIHIHKSFRIKTDHAIETVMLVNDGIDKMLTSKLSLGDTIEVNLFDEDYKSLKINRSYWGTFEKLESKGKVKNAELSRTALTGNVISHSEPPALYLKDNNKPLVLVGNTKIKGTAFLPERGAKSGNIAGKSYYNEKFVYGSTKLSDTLPKLNKDLIAYLNQIKSINRQKTVLGFDEIKAKKTLKNSFSNQLRVIHSPTDIDLSDISITGHYRINSDTKITVHDTAKLTDVLLTAPEIEVNSDTVGTFQAIASERIHVNKNVNLNYPSALVLFKDYVKDELSDSRMIRIEDNSKISGQVLALGKTTPNNYDSQIKIDANAIVEGTVYCEQNLELRGTVYGSVYTDNLIIKEAGSTFQNHLFNALIDTGKLTSGFVSINLENAKRGIAKWLY